MKRLILTIFLVLASVQLVYSGGMASFPGGGVPAAGGCTGTGQLGQTGTAGTLSGGWENISLFTAPNDICGKYVHAYTGALSTGEHISLGIYDASYNLLASCEITGPDETVSWKNCLLDSEVQLSNGVNYHIFYDHDASIALHDSGSDVCTRARDLDQYYSTPPDPWPTEGDTADTECEALVVSDTSDDPT